MEAISVFDMLKIGVGPSSSHTLGPWRAVQRWLAEDLGEVAPHRIELHLYGSLALTGRGHATDVALCLALLGEDPVTVDVDSIAPRVQALREARQIRLHDQAVAFDPAQDIHFHGDEALEEHPNGLICRAIGPGEQRREAAFFSVGGGFVLRRGESGGSGPAVQLPYPAQKPSELLAHCDATGLPIAALVRENERAWRNEAQIDVGLQAIWTVMVEAAYRGCHREGTLPGGLRVQRRAPKLCRGLLGADHGEAADAAAWLAQLRELKPDFSQMLRWLSCFALAVNEENASLGRIVTAPTNGAAGVIPAVLLWHHCFNAGATGADIPNFLLVAGEIGTHFKKGATISAALGGCQAEIGVSSAMAAGALASVLGGSPRQCLQAAEIAMEHHLGMTCDPVGGLVQIPCIERNTMGAVKAVNAAQLALVGDPANARVSLDDVIRTMDQTARDMSAKYKETSQGGLAVNIPVGLAEC